MLNDLEYHAPARNENESTSSPSANHRCFVAPLTWHVTGACPLIDHSRLERGWYFMFSWWHPLRSNAQVVQCSASAARSPWPSPCLAACHAVGYCRRRRAFKKLTKLDRWTWLWCYGACDACFIQLIFATIAYGKYFHAHYLKYLYMTWYNDIWLLICGRRWILIWEWLTRR